MPFPTAQNIRVLSTIASPPNFFNIGVSYAPEYPVAIAVEVRTVPYFPICFALSTFCVCHTLFLGETLWEKQGGAKQKKGTLN